MEDECSLLRPLEAFEHANDLVLLIQTKLSPRQGVDQGFRLVEGLLEIVCLRDDWHLARYMLNNLGRTNSL